MANAPRASAPCVYFAYDPSAIGKADIDGYVRCYSAPGAMGTSLEYDRTCFDDEEHNRACGQTKLTMPILALGGAANMGTRVLEMMQPLGTDVSGGAIERCGHWVPEERPEWLLEQMPMLFEAAADPKGTRVEVYADGHFIDEDRTPKGFTPLKLGHLAFKVLDIQWIVGFYRDVLGFRVSDWREGPDHHTVNFATAEKVEMHHVAFELKDMAEILRACDFLGRNGYRPLWGPGRHVIGDHVLTYHRDPDGDIIELYCELARIDSVEIGQFVPRPWRHDRPYRPTTWGPDTLGNLWGPGPSAGFGN